MSTTKILPVPFAVARCFGIWEPAEWTHRWKKNLYHFLSAFVLFAMYSFVASQLVEVIVHFFKHKGISETLYILVTTSSICYKVAVFLIRKRDIYSLSQMLLHEHCIAEDADEQAIQKRFDDVNRYIMEIGLLLIIGDILLTVIAPLSQTANNRNLPFKTWLPYSIQEPCNYWLSYVHQTLASGCCGPLSMAFDNIVTGFMWQACAQFEILEHRFKNLPERVLTIRSQMTFKEASHLEKTMLARHLQHQNYIYQYVKDVMNTFSSIIFAQCCASALVITVSVYQLSMTSPKNMDFATVLLYLIVMLMQFLMYCWFGNEVNIRSIKLAETVYQSNWMILNFRSWKMIMFLIHRSSKPIVISCYNIVVLSLNTYVQVLKFSYSAYNLLRKSNGD